MKKASLLFTAAACALFAQAAPIHAAPKTVDAKTRGHIVTMLKDENTTRAIIHELMQSSKTKQLLATMLKPDAEFRGYYSSARENAGGG
jgi:hypothetical protein